MRIVAGPEGRTEYDVYSTAAKKLQRLHPERSCSFDLLGIALVQANTDTQVAPLGEYYKKMGKTVYAIFDKQDDDIRKKIEVAVDYPYEATEHGIEERGESRGTVEIRAETCRR